MIIWLIKTQLTMNHTLNQFPKAQDSLLKMEIKFKLLKVLNHKRVYKLIKWKELQCLNNLYWIETLHHLIKMTSFLQKKIENWVVAIMIICHYKFIKIIDNKGICLLVQLMNSMKKILRGWNRKLINKQKGFLKWRKYRLSRQILLKLKNIRLILKKIISNYLIKIRL